MADQLLDQLRDAVEGQIVCSILSSKLGSLPSLTHTLQDFEGQKLAEYLATGLLSIIGVRHYLTSLYITTLT